MSCQSHKVKKENGKVTEEEEKALFLLFPSPSIPYCKKLGQLHTEYNILNKFFCLLKSYL